MVVLAVQHGAKNNGEKNSLELCGICSKIVGVSWTYLDALCLLFIERINILTEM